MDIGHSLVTLADGHSIALFGGETVQPDEVVDMDTLNDLHILVLPPDLAEFRRD